MAFDPVPAASPFLSPPLSPPFTPPSGRGVVLSVGSLFVLVTETDVTETDVTETDVTETARIPAAAAAAAAAAACGRRLVVVVTETCGPRDTRPAFGGRGWCRSFPGLVAPCAAALATGVPFCSSFRRCCCWGVAPPHDLKPCSMRRMQGAVARINTDGPHAELSTSPDGIACMHARGAVHVWQPARLRTLCAHVGFRARCAEAR